jgi:predicted lipid-binding transport protein (Tim44 family)
MKRWFFFFALLGGLAIGLDDAAARMGGGGGFGGGGGSGGGSSSGGGAEAFVFELIFRLLIWLCVEHPVVGIPLTIIIVTAGVIAWSQSQRTQKFRSGQSPGSELLPPSSGGGAAARGLDLLRACDPNFSELLFEDLAQLVYRRSLEARGNGDFAVVKNYLADEVVEMLSDARPGSLSDVIIGVSELRTVEVWGATARIRVRFESNVTEDQKKLYRCEDWVFRRAADVLSPPPDRMIEFRCVQCGSPMETDVRGNCRSCGTAYVDGRVQWQVEKIELRELRPVRPAELTRGGGVEQGTDLPTRIDPRLVPELRALCARHPEFEPGEFTPWVANIFVKLQEAWSELRWEKARPYLTDPLFQSLRYQIEQYRRSNYRNHGRDIEVRRIEYVKAALDPYYEAITLRIRASMLDWTTNDAGAVIGGSKGRPRIFSEYWTFVRAVGKGDAGVTNPERCPSCGGPLDRVNEGGVCGYCGTRISAAEHSWVLSKITQDEVYRG